MVKYDGTVRNSRGGVIQFLYGEDGMDGASIETQRLKTISMSDGALRKAYLLDVSDSGFGKDRITHEYILQPSIVQQCKQDEELKHMLQAEFEQICEDAQTLRQIMYRKEAAGARANDKTLPLPRCARSYGLERPAQIQGKK